MPGLIRDAARSLPSRCIQQKNSCSPTQSQTWGMPGSWGLSGQVINPIKCLQGEFYKQLSSNGLRFAICNIETLIYSNCSKRKCVLWKWWGVALLCWTMNQDKSRRSEMNGDEPGQHHCACGKNTKFKAAFQIKVFVCINKRSYLQNDKNFVVQQSYPPPQKNAEKVGKSQQKVICDIYANW